MTAVSTALFSSVLASAWATVGWVLLWIGIGLLGLLTLFAVVPVHLWANGAVDDLSVAGRVRVRWGWGLIAVRLSPERGVTLHVLGLRLWTFALEGTDRPKDKKDKPKKPRRRGMLQWFLRYRQATVALARRLIRTLRLQLRLQGELGLGDPAATALCNRLLWELNRASEGVTVSVEPEWLDERVLLDGEVRARLWLAHIGVVLLWALWNRETRQMIRAVPRAGR